MNEMRGILESQERMNIGEKLRASWIFETAIEKILITLGIVLSFYSIIRIIFQGVW